MRKLAHIGIPTKETKENMCYLEALKVAVTSPDASKHLVEWLKFDDDCTLPRLMQENTHIAYYVDDINAELEGAEILIPLCTLPDGTKMSYIIEEGLPIELLEPIS